MYFKSITVLKWPVSYFLVVCMRTAKLVAPEKNIMKIPRKLWAASFICTVEEKSGALLSKTLNGLLLQAKAKMTILHLPCCPWFQFGFLCFLSLSLRVFAKS